MKHTRQPLPTSRMPIGFFRNQRKYSIATIQKAIKGRVPNRPFELGPIIPGVDDQLVPFLDRSVTYSYRNSNIGMLDSLLGRNWDIHMSCGVTKFVIRVKFHLSKGDQLSGLVKMGEYPGEVCIGKQSVTTSKLEEEKKLHVFLV